MFSLTKKIFIPAALALFCLLPGMLQGQVHVNFAEALQKSLYFYDANKSGPGIDGGRLSWRGDSEISDQWIPLVPLTHGTSANGLMLTQAFIDKYRTLLDPNRDGGCDLSGGMHDAGDHVKFGLPQSYSLATLGWGLYEFKQSFIDIGSYDHMLEILKWFADYMLRSAFIDSSGELVAFCYQVGEGSTDHIFWGIPELTSSAKFPRPAYFACADYPASDQCAGAAAALTTMYFNFRGIDAAYAQRCLDTAIALYKFAVANRGIGYSGGFYGSMYDEDEMAWAAVWLYEATGDLEYIADIMSLNGNHYTGYIAQIVKSTDDDWNNGWVHCWDVVWGGVFLKLACLFPDNSLYDYYARWNIEYWSGGAVPHQGTDGNYLNYTPGGYAMINTWGSARYNTAAQFCALVYAKHKNRPDMARWARGQMIYIMGDNPLSRSYIVGYGENYARHPHHRAAHGSSTNDQGDPAEHRHTLWGALVGGPDGKDWHNDVTSDFAYNEVAIDYNAGFVGALAGHYDFFGRAAGDQPLADFPPNDEPTQEFSLQAKLDSDSTDRLHVLLDVYGQLFIPPFYAKGLSARYFVDVSELVAVGQSASDLTFQIMYDENFILYDGPATFSGPHPWDAANNIYYFEINWSGLNIYGSRELLFAISVSQGPGWVSYLDSSNDPSRKGMTREFTYFDNIPLYNNGVLVQGVQPPSSGMPPTPPPATPSPTPATGTPTSTPAVALRGDVNGDGQVNIVDALIVAQFYVGLNPPIVNLAAADVDCNNTVNIIDALQIAQKYVGLLAAFSC